MDAGVAGVVTTRTNRGQKWILADLVQPLARVDTLAIA